MTGLAGAESVAPQPPQLRGLLDLLGTNRPQDSGISMKDLDERAAEFLGYHEQLLKDWFPGLGRLDDETLLCWISRFSLEQGERKQYARALLQGEMDSVRRILDGVREQGAAGPCGPQVSDELLLLREIALEGVVIADYAHCLVKGKYAGFGLWKTNMTHSYPVFEAAKMLLRSKVDRVSIAEIPVRLTSVFLLRQAIELRLRHALGIVSVSNDSGRPVRVDGSKLLTLVKNANGAVDMKVSCRLLEGVFGWTNRYIHSGLRPYLWEAEYACFLLAPLFAGVIEPDGSQNLYGAVRIKKAFYEDVERELRTLFPKQKISLARSYHPEAIIEP